MRGLSLACFILSAGSVIAQVTESSPEDPVTEHPTVILKQINEINDDGTYTVGYEATDGTFKLETRDEEGNVEGKYGYLNAEGEIVIVEYSANNATGFTSDAASSVGAAPSPITGQVEAATQSPEFILEQQRHAAVLAHQARVIEKQTRIAQQRDDAAQRRSFAAQRGGFQGQQQRRPVFNAAQFNPNRPAADQFNTQNFNQDFQQFQQQQQQQQFAPRQQQQQQFAPRQQQQFQQQPQRPAFESQFQQFQNQQQQQQFAPQQQQQFAPQQQQQFAPQQQQQFAPQQQQFAPQQQQQFQQPHQPAPLIPTSQLTLEDIALEGFSRDEDQDGQIDPLPAHLQRAQSFQQPQQFAQQPQQFSQQPQQFSQQPRQQFRGPAPVAPSPVGQQQFFQQQQQQQGFQQSQGFQTGF